MRYKFRDLIEEVTERNSNLEYGLDDTIGVTIEKGLIPTVANLSQTALDKFYIVRHNTFIYNPRTHGVRIGMGFNKTDKAYITSWNNVAFKVKKTAESIVNPDYLWLYFCRSEWDRETNYYALGSSTIVFLWSIFLDIEIDLPEISIQDSIVEKYRILQGRIELKKKINDNLAATINAYFAEFYATKCPNEAILSDICTLASSKRVFADDYVANGIPFYRGGEITLKQSGEPITDPLYITEEHFQALKEKYGAPVCNDILITAVGTIGNSYLVEDEEFYFKDGNIIWLKNFTLPEYSIFIYDYMQSEAFKQQLDGICIGSTQTALTIVSLSQLKLCIPDEKELAQYFVNSRTLRNEIQQNNKEILALHDMTKTLLSALSNR